VSGLASLSLRRPLDLPPLPAAYLAEVYAHIKLGEPEAGYESSPGVQYLAAQLRQLADERAAEAAAAGGAGGAGGSLREPLRRLPLLSLDAELAGEGLTVAAASVQAGEAPPRLRARRLECGALELSLRGGPPKRSRFSAVGHIWAWPLPQVGGWGGEGWGRRLTGRAGRCWERLPRQAPGTEGVPTAHRCHAP
jgi:hypothetical protein